MKSNFIQIQNTVSLKQFACEILLDYKIYFAKKTILKFNLLGFLYYHLMQNIVTFCKYSIKEAQIGIVGIKWPIKKNNRGNKIIYQKK